MSEKTEETKKPSTDELIVQLLKAQEETKNNINMLAKAIVEVNKKVETQPKTQTGSSDPLTQVLALLKPTGGTIEDFAKQAESMAKAAEALDRYRNPSRLGLGDAFLMRLGLRAAYPRYMTKTEIQKAEKALGIWESLEGKEGETEHVSE